MHLHHPCGCGSAERHRFGQMCRTILSCFCRSDETRLGALYASVQSCSLIISELRRDREVRAWLYGCWAGADDWLKFDLFGLGKSDSSCCLPSVWFCLRRLHLSVLVRISTCHLYIATQWILLLPASTLIAVTSLSIIAANAESTI